MNKTVIFSTIAIIASLIDLICIYTDILNFTGNTLAEKEASKSLLVNLCCLIMVVAIFIAARSKRSKRQNVEN